MQKIHYFVVFIILSMLFASCTVPNAATEPKIVMETDIGEWPTKSWKTSTPEEQGMEVEKLDQMMDSITSKDVNLHSLLIVKNGMLVYETYWPPYTADDTHLLYSCTKSFVSTLVGIALEEGHITSLDQSVIDFFPELALDEDRDLKTAMTLEDVLKMQTGLDWKEGMPAYIGLSMAPDAMQYMLDLQMASQPGQEFLYCSGCTHLLSGILQEATEMDTLDYGRDRLLSPLGIEDFTWEADRQGTVLGGWGLAMTPRDMARFGYLYLMEGVWEGEQIVPQDWIMESVENTVPVEPGLAYGYQWWVFPELKMYAAQGMEGQKIYVIPEYEMVVVMTAELRDTSIQLELLEEWILPSVKDQHE